ncbi:MAG: AAA family ATPase, partial [Verrucomicrobiota bacterium]|nr:AAA family ATPase [Verrucomicrobiota bacterium]
MMTMFLLAVLPLVPWPQEVSETGGGCPVSDGEIARAVASYEPDAAIPAEGYRLSVGDSSIRVASSSPAGAFYAGETLRQLRGADGRVPHVAISDAPKFPWRGVMLDLGSVQPDRAEELEGLFTNILEDEANRNGIALRRGESAPITFRNLLNDLAAASPDGQVVLLVDEYDKPLLRNLNTPAVREFRDALKAFYSVIKTLEGKQRFTFITGISKFSKVSIFSDLNNLKDRT